MKPIVLDYETYYHKKEYSISGLGNWRYCHHEQFDPYLLSVYDGEQSWVGHPRDFFWEALGEYDTLVAHNASFDSSVTRALCERGVAPQWVADIPWQCTANMASALFSVRSLADSVLVARNRKLDKSTRDAANGLHWEQMEAMGLSVSMAKYAKADAVECFNLWRDFSPKWSSFERRLSSLTLNQCARGVAINTELLDVYLREAERALGVLHSDLPWLVDGCAPTSTIAIAQQCRKVGIPTPPVKDRDEEGFIKWEAEYGPRFSWIVAVGQFRQVNKLLTTLRTIKERLRPDGTIDFSLLYHGSHTGRWSGGGSGLNLQNLRKEPLYLQDGRIVFPPACPADHDPKAWMQAWLDSGIFALDVRALLVPRAGKKFIISDLSQIEPRVLNWLAGNQALLDVIRQGFSVYEAFARVAEGWTGEAGTLKKALGGKKYTLLKNKVLGLGYQMGPARFCEYAGVDEETAEAVVSNFRESNPMIVGLWNTLNNSFRDSVDSDFEVGLPSGRSLVYRQVRRDIKNKRNKEGKMEPRFVFSGKIGLDRYDLYGGLLTENLVQATARDVFGEHLLALEENVGDVIFHVHDEAIVECDPDVPAKEVERVMSVTPEWIPGLPLAAEAQEAKHYLK